MDVSIYSKLANEKLEDIHVRLTEEYGKDLQDDSKPSEERKIAKLAESKAGHDKQAEKITAVREFVKEYVYRELKDLAMIEYLAMEKCKDFGIHGEQNITISFCRNILSIPNNREVTQFDADRFRRILQECDKRHGNKSAEDYQAYIKNFSLEIFGKKYTNINTDQVNKLFDLLDVNYYLLTTTAYFIFGIIEKKSINDKNVIIFQREYIRSPVRILSAIANVHNDGMIIRDESCEVIFFNKWQKFYDQSKLERIRALRRIDSTIREGLKEYVLSLYNAVNTADVLNIKDIFIREMKDGIVWHEIGHLIADADMDPIHDAFSNRIAHDFKIGHVLQEALADNAPIKDQQKGAFARFVELAKTDVMQATINLYVYMSDNWFLDEDKEEAMGLMSNVLVALALCFINTDGSVDFDRLAGEHEKIYTFMLKRFGILCSKLLDVIRNSQYDIDTRQLGYIDLVKEILDIIQNPQNKKAGHQFDYSYFENKVKNEFQDSGDTSPLEKLPKLETFWSFWKLMTEYLEKCSKTGWEQYQNVQMEEAAELERLIFMEILKVDGEKYENSLHEYIVERVKEIGILKTLPEIDVTAVVNKTCNELKMPKAEREKVQAKFAEIINGRRYDIAINYRGKEDFFILVLQEMLLRSGYGNINSSMVIGEYYDPQDYTESRRQYIEDELETLRDQIESEMYLEINVLRVNNKYPAVKPMVEELLHTITFIDGCKLAGKIKTVEYMPLDGDFLFEVFIPLKRGYMDWNTSQAVWRINQDIRPYEFCFQWTIDRDFMEALVCSQP